MAELNTIIDGELYESDEKEEVYLHGMSIGSLYLTLWSNDSAAYKSAADAYAHLGFSYALASGTTSNSARIMGGAALIKSDGIYITNGYQEMPQKQTGTFADVVKKVPRYGVY